MMHYYQGYYENAARAARGILFTLQNKMYTIDSAMDYLELNATNPFHLKMDIFRV